MPTRHALIVATVCLFIVVAAIGYKCDTNDDNGLYHLENAHIKRDLPDSV